MQTETNPPANGVTGEGTTPSVNQGTTPATVTSVNPAPPAAPPTAPTLVLPMRGLVAEPPAPEPPIKAHPFHRSAQDAEEAAAINRTRKLVGILTKDPDMAPLRDKGFDTQNLTATLGLCAIADKKFDNRQLAIAAQLGKTSKVGTLFGEAEKVYVDFRETARTVFPDEASLKALKVTDVVPNALPNFLTDARSAYTTAKTAPYTTELSKKGYAPATLDDHLTTLETLRLADEEQARLIGDAQKATTERRDAVAPVQKFQSDVMRVARRVFRKAPELLKKLDFRP